jgi:hypothetical protein
VFTIDRRSLFGVEHALFRITSCLLHVKAGLRPDQESIYLRGLDRLRRLNLRHTAIEHLHLTSAGRS